MTVRPRHPAAQSPLARVVGAWPLLFFGCAVPGCLVQEAGTDRRIPGVADAMPPRAESGADGGDLPDDEPDTGAPDVATFLAGAPAALGCADGTREAFLDATPSGWPDIAGCAGGWSVPGLLGDAVDRPQCGRMTGDRSANPDGIGCAAGDLCAAGWHVCRSPAEVERISLSACESAVPRGVAAFFAAATAAGPAGTCAPLSPLANDLHGCGSFGQPEAEGCFPLDRRLGFADCRATAGVWRCGDADHHLEEASLVTKSKPQLGGVLCCRGP